MKLLWLSIFRMVTTTLLLSLLAVRLFTADRPELSSEDSLSFLVIGIVYLATLGYAIVLRRGEVNERAAWVQVLGDVLLATSLVYVTGGAESPFAFMYLLAIVAGAILLYQRGAFGTAFASALFFATLIVALQLGWLRMPPGASQLSLSRLTFVLVSNVLAQLLIAALASYLSRQLQAAGGRLTAREGDLRKLARLQRQILTSMPSGLVTCASDGTITFANPSGEAILGFSAGASIGRNVDQLIPGVRALSPQNRRNALDVETPRGRRTLGLTAAPLESGDGALLIVFQDLTEVRRLEDELRRVDRLAAVGRLSAQLAHEIRNPLAAMRGSAQMIATDPTGKTAPRLADILVRESDRLAGLLEDFLRFARPPPPSLQPCSLKDVVRETLEMLKGDPLAQSARLDAALDDVVIPADAAQLRQVIINLVRNALAAAEDGQVKVSVSNAGASAELRVWDSAGSIPQADLARVFEPFFTTREGGTGLGLSTAHSIVRAHGGSIQVRSSPEQGTEFLVLLPLRAEVGVEDPGRR